jgi:hypothetical protein
MQNEKKQKEIQIKEKKIVDKDNKIFFGKFYKRS